MKASLALAVLFTLCIALSSCMLLDRPRGSAWRYGPESGEESSIILSAVSVDRWTEAASVERELLSLGPLLFLEQGFPPPPDGTSPRYRAEIRATEREFLTGWKTERSLSLEVRISDTRSGGFEVVGRATASGDRTLLSSRDLAALLTAALRPAAEEIRNREPARPSGAREK